MGTHRTVGAGQRAPGARGLWTFIDTTPVTNGQYQQFIEDGGYQQERWWSAGWATGSTRTCPRPVLAARFGTVDRRRLAASSRAAGERGARSYYEAGPTPRGPANACHRQEWRRWRFDPAPGAPGGIRGGQIPGRSTPTPDSGTCNRPRRRLSGRGHAVQARQLIGDVWEWTSPTPAYPGSLRSRTGVLEVSSAATTALRGGVRHRPAGVPGHLPNWDFPSAGRYSPDSAWPHPRRERSADVPARGAPGPATTPLAAGNRSTRCWSSPGPPRTCAREDQRRRVRRRWHDTPEAQRCTATTGRSARTRPSGKSPDRPQHRGGRRSALGTVGAPEPGGVRTVPQREMAVQPQREGHRLAEFC